MQGEIQTQIFFPTSPLTGPAHFPIIILKSTSLTVFHLIIYGLKPWLNPLLSFCILFCSLTPQFLIPVFKLFLFSVLVQKSNSAAVYNASAGATDR